MLALVGFCENSKFLNVFFLEMRQYYPSHKARQNLQNAQEIEPDLIEN
jgi:hypothetical protein